MSAAETSDFSELFAELSREPDFDAPELQAHDAADELILATAADAVRRLGHGELVVIGDRHGALTLGAAGVLGARGIRTHQDPLLGERALVRNAERLRLTDAFASHALDAALLDGARVVLLQLPRGLDALEEIASCVARWAAPDVRVYAGGRVKHMTRAMNEVLGRCFAEVSAGLGWRKSRVLMARGPRDPGRPSFPRWGDDAALPFRVAAYGATFGGPTLDHGSRLLLAGLGDAAPGARRIVDLGCGNGVLAVSAALARPEAAVVATDQSAAAVAATRLTVEAAGVAERVEIHRADALDAVPDGWAELILLNPPFHAGAAVHAGVAHRLIRACRRALAPGGELRLVFNSHLRYRALVERAVGPSRQVARDRTFTVLSAIRG
ncbi:class I SAM-dependent methyltransferase [Leucobacter triazinivorans]|uniref:Methyltransferase domain-containing protein n=1 Tax=Leucobacter triazinivorans TaxID=1784719 RepID=A0A4P6KFE6_9MICO|nr:methyltransferase [Leucobacter triazinivorans]QBE49195.1 methyltransferase domain-containing protein [Leucobacter triazinivorans]